jgi:hypothetical protein
MTRCNCKTLKGVQCKKDALEGSKTCSIHKKCNAKASKARVASVKKAPAKKVSTKKAPAKKARAKASPAWVKSRMWVSPEKDWFGGGEKDKTKVMSPQNADPWWMR